MFDQLKYPIIQAPMAGGAATAELAMAVSRKGGLGFLAAGYKTPAVLEKEILTCSATNLPFGVNLFVPNNDFLDDAIYTYKELLEKDFNTELAIPEMSDDFWHEKLALVEKYKVPYVSFTFGCPSNEIIKRLQLNGSKVIVTVTNESEAKLAEQSGTNAICLQGADAGGHRGSFQNEMEAPSISLNELLPLVCQHVSIPVIAAGGIMNGHDIHQAIGASASAVQLGTAFLCTEESGANEVMKQALQSNQFSETVYTRAFTGRLARGLKNDFIEKYERSAPAIYPAVHTVTQPIRARALQEKNPQAMSIWASTRFQEIKSGSVDTIFDQLIAEWNACKA